jgi:hypothetical protein
LQEPVAGLLQQHVVVPLHPPKDGVVSGRKGDRENFVSTQSFVYKTSSLPIVATPVRKSNKRATLQISDQTTIMPSRKLVKKYLVCSSQVGILPATVSASIEEAGRDLFMYIQVS